MIESGCSREQPFSVTSRPSRERINSLFFRTKGEVVKAGSTLIGFFLAQDYRVLRNGKSSALTMQYFFFPIASQYLDQSHHVFLTITRIDGFLEEAGDEIGNFRVDVGVNALLLDTL